MDKWCFAMKNSSGHCVCVCPGVVCEVDRPEVHCSRTTSCHLLTVNQPIELTIIKRIVNIQLVLNGSQYTTVLWGIVAHMAHYTWHTWYTTLHMAHMVHYTWHTWYTTLHMAHMVHYTTHGTLHYTWHTTHGTHGTHGTLHYTWYTWYTTLHMAHYTTHGTLHMAHYTWYTTHGTLHMVHYTWHTTHGTLHMVHMVHYTTHGTHGTLHYTWHTALHYTTSRSLNALKCSPYWWSTLVVLSPSQLRLLSRRREYMIARYEYADVVSGGVWCAEWVGVVLSGWVWC